ncbi:MAG: ribonuclease H [SAR86 cluster bacterium BACL1 MAG-120828-bin5]|jgi:ribonuclease HI|uniref:Ribonuclease H n=1 Tax=SAR86 cluster bacterium BACL1 MAG-120820-bin45 TaxID=1655612 RepID=A0A0R2U624_9GAMM|nr:MAG: ribonuclease H [SAR86 cluster bacterium BACL1 MAG-120507-bin14]KRO94981.1 MAG: ribonuclease H [SAR86 cluster bacterium BACL1 MAG-120820-bin45]KRO95071.1 MAG: ribonuclease H [SAR86 cluster bacterium BACL1 MAG-120828-bin5]KRO99794.1 MAG: ribonuclease H [SAR86 cluster bacterium BACL1 MAG-120813-bin36]KRP02049.1 MAG: ribonuclease H [SAR86 cluster bacterium BACL1 MAG-120924-bin88]KRP08833.1 MAG: ribonuclease H [SAR86 cluster bacterium BACL1 MAG-121004-bin11]KRP15195.1 MAG: ribonuclease H [
MKQVIMYTDGACRGNPGPGGWGAFITYEGASKEIFGGKPDATNNQMELSAAIEGMVALKEPCQIDLFTDSKYVMDGITQWIHNWKKNNWRTAAKKDVKNKELWQKLDELINFHQVQWHWVKGHSGDEGNEMADLLANKGIDSIL